MKKKENDPPWYAEEAGFFSEWYFDTVDIKPKNDNAPIECDFIERTLKPPSKKDYKILDLCCGYGRITNLLAQRGYNITGLDLNQYFLELAKEEACKQGLDINWVKSDMRDIPFENTFEAVINMFTSFGYLSSDKEDEKVIQAVYRALKPKGKFILDYVNKDFIIRYYRTEEIRRIDKGELKITREYNFLKSSHIDTYEIITDGKTAKKFISDFRFYSVTELARMLVGNGFHILDVFGDYNSEPLSFDSKNCIILAEKTD
jgi:SAM-dependent methyltransferase